MLSLSDPLLVQTVANFRKQVEVNLVGMFAVTRAFAPLLGADLALAGPKGRIVNISSVGGKIGPPFLGAYAAAKHGVESFSESFRRELQLVGIDVIVGPGSVATPIWDKAEATSSDYLIGTIWERPFRAFTDYLLKDGREGLAPERIGEVVRTALTPEADMKVAETAKPSHARLPSSDTDHVVGRSPTNSRTAGAASLELPITPSAIKAV